MVVRHNRTTGEAFWGCRNFPACRGTRRYEGPPVPPRRRVEYDDEYRRSRTTGEEFEKPDKEP
jgi:ssDNA-binding Zn-finger/Zn-ribbon topoisomerase 1